MRNKAKSPRATVAPASIAPESPLPPSLSLALLPPVAGAAETAMPESVLPPAPETAPAESPAPAGSRASRAQAAMRSANAGAVYLAAFAVAGGDATGKRFPVKPVPVAPGVLRGSDFTARSGAALIACAVAHGVAVQPGNRIPLRFADSLYLESGAAHDCASRYGMQIDYAGADCAFIVGTNSRALLMRGFKSEYLNSLSI